MPRHPDPHRKPVLLEKILDHLLDKSLASLSFRTLAKALGVSTFTLVYHFGTRAELVSEIVGAISSRAAVIEQELIDNPGTLEVYFEGHGHSWDWTLEPRNRQLQRLEFEAAMLEALAPEEYTHTRRLFDTWVRIGRTALVSFGVPEADAELESRVLVDTFFGIQYDLLVTGDEERATAEFHHAMEHHRVRVEALLAGDRVV